MGDVENYMQRAMELALLGQGNVSPNPLVGCVIVKDGKIIGEGWHKKHGDAHAEVNAINSVADKSQLKGADLYVNLEPCAHHGKTPPCADLIAQYPFSTVYFSNIDPNPLVAGQGAEKIFAAGIKVYQGILEKEGRHLNRRFFSRHEKKRPYIILKWAETADGFIAKSNYESKWISGVLSRKLVHQWRSQEDAVFVGTNTVLFDNPQLNVREWSGRDPIRMFIDKQLQVPQGAHVFDKSQPTVCFNFIKQKVENQVEYVKLDPLDDLSEVISNDMQERGVMSVMVEGGTQLIQSLIDKGLWDEARIFISPSTFGEGIRAPQLQHAVLQSRENIEQDQLSIFTRKENA
ncbi:MAG: bifunctional diaminohydroxyphosphoribosylaminopyrimidine deaminase/5-amino-6-(5-phosphoribosylamino)uracil reductase RibD [Cytophagaceae bacterium]|nr:bifunctional diaminohydroxyphosphoribosylaminopyrimidine deaminase/5-amino-6-(5-phosphoribosylamino)uracil reductase RibD [Cytophagaceae bacterium]